MNSVLPIPEFIPSIAGKIFTLTFNCNGSHCEPPHSQLILIPPFAEEANKSRHIISKLGRELALIGVKTTVVDLFGCGDSEGDLDQVSMQIWHKDIEAAISHSAKQTGSTNIAIGGIRLGATIAASYISQNTSKHQISNLLLMQPVIDGKNYIKQFIRLKLAESITSNRASNKSPASTTEIIELLEQGEPQEISGYMLTKQLFNDINNLSCNLQNINSSTNTTLLDINPQGSQSIPLKKFTDKHTEIEHLVCQGSQFWACQEIAQCDELIDLCTKLFITTSGVVNEQ